MRKQTKARIVWVLGWIFIGACGAAIGLAFASELIKY